MIDQGRKNKRIWKFKRRKRRGGEREEKEKEKEIEKRKNRQDILRSFRKKRKMNK